MIGKCRYARAFALWCVLLGFSGVLSAKSLVAEELFSALNVQAWLDSTASALQSVQSKAQASSCLSEVSKKALKSEMTKAIKFVQKDGKALLLQMLDSSSYKGELLDLLRTPVGRKLVDALVAKNMSIFSYKFQAFEQYEDFWSDEFSLQDMRAFTTMLASKAPGFAQEYGAFATRLFEQLESKELQSINPELARCGISFEEYYYR